MNILVILKNLKNKHDFYEKYGILLKHIDGWSKENNKIYIITRHSKDIFGNLDVDVINPPKYLFNNILLSVWFKLVNHPGIDLIIESISLFPFIYSKAEKVLYFPSDSVRKNFFGKIKGLVRDKFYYHIIKLLFRESFYLVSSSEQFTNLAHSKVPDNKRFLLQQGFENIYKKEHPEKSVAKNIIFIGKDVQRTKEALGVFKEIERRDEGWKYNFVLPKEMIKKAKEELTRDDLINHSKIWPYESEKTPASHISKSGVILELGDNDESFRHIVLSLALGIPVLTYKSKLTVEYHALGKSVFASESKNYQELARFAMEYVKVPSKYHKMVLNGYDFAHDFTWEGVSQKSLRFLESIRPE